jgi:hypothetical protein
LKTLIDILVGPASSGLLPAARTGFEACGHRGPEVHQRLLRNRNIAALRAVERRRVDFITISQEQARTGVINQDDEDVRRVLLKPLWLHAFLWMESCIVSPAVEATA